MRIFRAALTCKPREESRSRWKNESAIIWSVHKPIDILQHACNNIIINFYAIFNHDNAQKNISLAYLGGGPAGEFIVYPSGKSGAVIAAGRRGPLSGEACFRV
jgi:hypothetical protein